MGNMEEENLLLLNMNQEDDYLIGISPANSELCITGVSPLSPSMMPKALNHAGTDDLENCYGKLEVGGVPAVVGADVDSNMAPMPCRSPMIPNSGSKVLSVLNFNEMNKRSVTQDAAEESKIRKSFGVRESMQLGGINETSPVLNPQPFTSQLSRSYRDIENELAGVTPGKAGRDPTVIRKSRSRRSTALRKSLAWDKAFFTDEGVLDNDELFAVASDTPKTLAMPELATIWHGPQNIMTSFQASAKTKHKSEIRPGLRSGLNSVVRPELRTEARPEVRPSVDPKPQKDIFHTSLRSDSSDSSSLQPLQRIHITGSHAFSNAYSRAAAIPQGSTLLPLPSSLTRTVEQPGAIRNPIDHSHGTGPDMKESRSTTTGLHHQARITALKKAHEATPQKGFRVRLPNSISNKKVEDKHVEVSQMVKQLKKVEIKSSEEVSKMHVFREKQPRKVEDKPSEDIHKKFSTRANHPTLTRSMSTSSLLEAPSALSRKVSSISKRVKETLGQVMSGRARRAPPDTSLSHVHPLEKGSLLPKMIGGLPTVPEVKDPNFKTRSNAAVAPMKDKKDTYTVKDILRGKGPPSCPKGASKQGPTLTRSKSAFTVPSFTRATDPGLARVVFPPSPSAPSVLPATPLLVKPAAETMGKPTSLRKPSPKLSFFDAGRAATAPQKAFAISQPFNCMRNNQPLRPASEASTPIEAREQVSRGLPPALAFSAIPTAPHLLHCVTSAPTSPRSIYIVHPSSPKGKSTASPRPPSSAIKSVNLVNLSGLIHAKQFAESHHLAKKMLVGHERGTAGAALETSALDAPKLPISPSSSTAENVEPTELGHGILVRSLVESNPPIAPAVNVRSPVDSDTTLESGGGEPDGNSLLRGPLEATRSGDGSSASASQLLHRSRSQPGENYALEHSHVSEAMPQETIEEVHEKIVASEAMESSVTSKDPTSASPSSSSSSVWRHHKLTKQAGFNCYSPRNSSFREMSDAAVHSCSDNKPILDTDIPPLGPTTPTRKECLNVFNPKISRQFESPRSKSFRETPLRPEAASGSPVPATKHVRSFSQRLPWHSPGGEVVGSSPGFGPSTPASGGKSHTIVSPSHAPDSAGTFEVLTPSGSKNARCVRTPGSSSKKVIRKIVEFESPSLQWSNWPVLGATISADQLPLSGTEGLSPTPRRPSGEQAPELQAKCTSNPLCTPLSKARHADGASIEHCTLDTEQQTDLRLSFSAGFVSSGCSEAAKFAEMECGSNDRNSSVGPYGTEACVSAKKEKGSSMFSFARKAVARLTSSPNLAEPPGQDLEEAPKPSSRMSRRFSRPGNSAATPEPEPPNLFSEARICELEAAGLESLQKKNGPVKNSPPDKLVPDSSPWSPVRKTGQPLGPFDCTKLTYISRGLENS